MTNNCKTETCALCGAPGADYCGLPCLAAHELRAMVNEEPWWVVRVQKDVLGGVQLVDYLQVRAMTSAGARRWAVLDASIKEGVSPDALDATHVIPLRGGSTLQEGCYVSTPPLNAWERFDEDIDWTAA